MTSTDQRIPLEKKLLTSLKKFKLSETKAHVLPLFEGLSWEMLKEASVKCNVGFHPKDVASLLVECLKDESTELLRTIYYNVLLLDIVYHTARLYWTAVAMNDKFRTDNSETRKCNIVQSFRSNYEEVKIYTKIKNNMEFIVLVQKNETSKNKLVYKPPLLLAIHDNYPYLFISSTNPSRQILKIIIEGLGYRKFSICKLRAKEISSMIVMINKKENATTLRKALEQIPNNIDIIRSSIGYDYTHAQERVARANKLLAKEEIHLNTYTINANTVWKGITKIPQLEGTEMKSKLIIRSKDVGETLEKMAKHGILKLPLPNWVKEYSISGRNTITIG